MANIVEKDRLIRRILRVNHAGEHGAIEIYTAQIARMNGYHPALVSWLQETRAHEVRHRDLFQAAMPSRCAKPCRAMVVWKIGGKVLGNLTAMLGPFGIMVCTAAVERTVHRHLSEQVSFLGGRDDTLAEIVKDVQSEEDSHLAFAEANHNPRSFLAKSLSLGVAVATEILIWISTRGDSLRLNRILRGAVALSPRA